MRIRDRYSYVTINGKTVPAHRAVWMKVNGPIPKGYVIHHLDGDGHNNDISNLALMTRGEHTTLHALARSRGVDVVDPCDASVRKSRESCAAYHAAHRAQISIKDAEYYQANKERFAKQRALHKSEKSAYDHVYYRAHKEQKAAYDAERRKLRNARQRLQRAISSGKSPEVISVLETNLATIETEYCQRKRIN